MGSAQQYDGILRKRLGHCKAKIISGAQSDLEGALLKITYKNLEPSEQDTYR